MEKISPVSSTRRKGSQCLVNIGTGIHVRKNIFENVSLQECTEERYGNNKGTNGTTTLYSYSRDGITWYAILKSTYRENADNLVYEYIVGKEFINKIYQNFPCFIYTYGLYYRDKRLKTPSLDDSQDEYEDEYEYIEPKQYTHEKEIDYHKACDDYMDACILIQDIHNAKTLASFVNSVQHFAERDLVPVLYIIYHALSELATTFTHYDLHANNVILCELVEPIEYVYGEIKFKCKYIPKIIDYGTCFFDNGEISSAKVHDNFKDCNMREAGLGHLLLPDDHRSSQKKNESCDLRLLVHIKELVRNSITTIPDNLSDLFQRIVFGVDVEIYDKPYFTKEDGRPYDNFTIHNVTGAKLALEKCIIEHNRRPPYKKVSGQLIIKQNTPVEHIRFVPLSSQQLPKALNTNFSNTRGGKIRKKNKSRKMKRINKTRQGNPCR